MQARQLPAQLGWLWLVNGWNLFRRQPIGFLTLFFTYVFGVLFATLLLGLTAQAIGMILPTELANVVGQIGSLAFAVLIPALSVGFMEACRVGERGETVLPHLLLRPLTADVRIARALLQLGILYACAVAAVLWLSTATGPATGIESPSPPVQYEDDSTSTAPEAAQDGENGDTATGTSQGDEVEAVTPEQLERLGNRLFLMSLVYLPVALAFWYAPILVAWHGVRPSRALFFSIVAFWRNRLAFMVYGMAWLGLSLLIPLVLAPITGLVGTSLASFIVLPFLLIFVVVTYCSFYFTYTTVFDASQDAMRDSTP